jgi:hypothetical protein
MLLLHYLLVRFDRLNALICPELEVQVQFYRRSYDVCVVGCDVVCKLLITPYDR